MRKKNKYSLASDAPLFLAVSQGTALLRKPINQSCEQPPGPIVGVWDLISLYLFWESHDTENS